jgi:monofunctional biosynthetic peptidoglycan transglycosylase
VEEGSQRYFGKSASNLSRQEAARIAAVLPQPKKREARAPSGFTRRYGNSIVRRIGVVARDGLDACLAGTGTDGPEPASPKAKRTKQAETPAPAPEPERVEDYIEPAPVQPEAEVDPVEPMIETESAPPAAEETNGF